MMTAEVLKFEWAVIAKERGQDVRRLQEAYFSKYKDQLVTDPSKYYIIGAYSKYCQKHFSVPWMYVTEVKIKTFLGWLDDGK